jgi:hypothetical protein
MWSHHVMKFSSLIVRQILDHARDEYLYIYSIYVLEASTSNRLTYFLPPLVSCW